MIPENFKTRLFSNGRLHLQLRKMNQIIKENPDSDFARTIYNKLKDKYWYGSKRVTYYDLFTESWTRLFPESNTEFIESNGLKFLNDNAFPQEFADIFIASGYLKKLILDKEKTIACEVLSLLSVEGSYENEDVQIKKGDVIIDAGANMGIFSLYASDRANKIYAFEPQRKVLNILNHNIALNDMHKVITIVPFGLSDQNKDYMLNINPKEGHVSASIIPKLTKNIDYEAITCITLDKWAFENNLKKIDFIKADIEGAERLMLRGSKNVLKEFAPRLSICTYHLPDDPLILEKIIKDANPKYQVKHSSHKLFAWVH